MDLPPQPWPSPHVAAAVVGRAILVCSTVSSMTHQVPMIFHFLGSCKVKLTSGLLMVSVSSVSAVLFFGTFLSDPQDQPQSSFPNKLDQSLKPSEIH